ncbi:MAG: hypothetical protein KGL74_10760, partial [Elusimicrobia bacterium]|nr:hypothetical protein [Elusimicrobiota bacterium]
MRSAVGVGVENAMKNPLPLLAAAVLLASFASAAATPSDRCDVAWLTQAQSVVTRSGSPADPNKYLTTKTVDGAVYPVLDPASAPKVCDANVWNLLAGKAPAAALLDPDAKAAWDMGLGEQIKILLATDDLFKAVDSQGAGALAKADAVAAAVAKIEDKNASPAEMTAALSSLLKDPAAAKGAKPGAPTAGPAVLAYRKAVIGLAADIAVHAASRGFAAARGVDAKMKTDFLKTAAGSYAAPAKAAGKSGSAEYADSVASDEGYASALKFLTEPASPAVSALAQFDASLRDRLVEKSAAADKAYAAARARLNGQSVKAALAAIAHDAKTAPKPGAATGAPAKGSLAADVLERLKATKEYGELNTLYDNKSKSDPAWAGSKEGKEAAAEMAAMRQDAANAAVVHTKKGAVVQYTVGGQKVTDEGIVVADLKTDKEYHEFIATAIASVISSDSKVNA